MAFVQECYAQTFWQDHVADTLDAIAYGLAHMGGKKTLDMKFVPYSEYAHPGRRMREKPKQTYEQIVQSVLDRM